MVLCSVKGCKNRSEKQDANITFHRFPPHEIERKNWIKACDKANWTPSQNSRICSVHFEAALFMRIKNKTYFKPHAVPTLHVSSLADMATASCSKIIPEKSSVESDTLPRTAEILLEQKTTVDQKVEAEVVALKASNKTKRKMDLNESVMPRKKSKLEEKSTLEQKQVDSDAIVKPERLHKIKRKLDLNEPVMPGKNSKFEEPAIEDTPRTKKLRRLLTAKSILAARRLKKLRAVRQTNKRLRNKNAQLKDFIAELQLKNLVSCEDADILSTIDIANIDVWVLIVKQ